MRLYLIQHGKYMPEEEAPGKPLSQEGREETEKIANFLKSRDITPDIILHSKKRRAIETAQILSQFLNVEAKERDDLNPTDPVEKFPAEILRTGKDIMIVGHLPFLQKLVSLLLTGKDDNEIISFIYSGLVCLGFEKSWQVKWFITPDLT